EEEEEEESQGGAFHSRAVSRRGGGWVRLRCAAGRSARGARGPLGAPLRAPVGSCEPGLALAEDGEGEQERQEKQKTERERVRKKSVQTQMDNQRMLNKKPARIL
ncbi:unnamed protein product, partial [Prorocentrum cordatum]